MKKIFVIILSFTLLLSISHAVFAESTEKRTVKVGVSADYKPFVYYENGELAGFDIELMSLVCQKAGLEAEFINMPFDSLITSVINGEIDCAISAITVTDERDKIIDYSREYLRTTRETTVDGQIRNKSGETYAVVFKEGLAGSPYKDITTPTDDEALYIMIDTAIRDLSQDRTVYVLIEKYELNSYQNPNAGYTVIYQDVRGHGSPAAKTEDEEPQTSATSIPCSNWARDYVNKAGKLNIANMGGNYNYPGAVTRESFCVFVYNYLYATDNVNTDTFEKIENKFTDTKNAYVLYLNKIGIIEGKSETEFAPDDLLTREEAATILGRLLNYVNPDLKAEEKETEFIDSDKISDWAYDSVIYLNSTGIMNGIGNGLFSPHDTFTTEQALTAIVRIYDNLNAYDNLSFADKLNTNMPNDRNYMFSPLSIKTVLTMAANGASGTTRDEILKAVGVKDLQSYNDSIRLMLDKYSKSDILKLNVSNSIWINSDKTSQHFSKGYTALLSEYFDATADTVTDKDAASKINGWVNEKTDGKIPAIISEDNMEFWAILVNAVYFQGRWQSTFNKGATKEDLFTSRDGTQTNTLFMNRNDWINLAVTDNVTITELPYLTREDIFNEDGEYVETKKLYGTDISMYLMFSDTVFNPEEVLKKAEFNTTYVSLSVPKFNVEYSADFSDILKNIGINKAFDMSAEFSEMFDSGKMWIDSVIQKTYITVDEEGTEAAAVTGMGMGGSSRPPEPLVIKYNKPFTFVIKDNASDEILFMGEYAFAK